MQNGSEQRPSDEAPLYIRWSPDRSGYAVELRLDLVAEISLELARAETLATEVGGVLVGSFPTAYSPTLRIEDVEFVPRGAGEGATYLLDPGQQNRFGEIRSGAQARQREAVGFFRSHLRPGVMRPSLADRTLLTKEFRDSVYAVLLIDGRQPHTATLFLAANGHLPGEPSVRNFRFDEREFRALPEVPPDADAPVSSQPLTRAKPSSPPNTGRARVYGSVAALLAIAVVACLLMWNFSKQASVPHILGEANPINLAVMERGNLLRISWDHAARELNRVSGATMIIADGPSRRELQLGVDELRLGAVEYERNGSQIKVTMIVNTQGAAGTAQSVIWGSRPTF